MKLLGNQKPQPIQELEQLLWQEISDVACGKQSALEACLKVGDQLKELSLLLEDDVRYFFKRGAGAQLNIYLLLLIPMQPAPTRMIPNISFVELSIAHHPAISIS